MSLDVPIQGVTINGRGRSVLIIGWSLCTIATTLITTRVYTRLKLAHDYGWALFWALCAFVPAIVCQCFATLSVRHGTGNHVPAIVLAGQARDCLLYIWLAILTSQLAIPIGKVAVASFMLALQAGTHPNRRRFLHFIAISNVVVSLPLIFLLIFACQPIDALWDPLNQEACHIEWSYNYAYFTGVWAALSDFAMAYLPVMLFWNLQISVRMKVGLSCLMGLGVFAGVAAILRCAELKKELDADFSWQVVELMHWGGAEMWILLIALNIPPNLPFFKWLWTLRKSDMKHPQAGSRQWPGNDQSPPLNSPQGGRTDTCQLVQSQNVAFNMLSQDSIAGSELIKTACETTASSDGWVRLNDLERAEVG